MPPPPPPSKSYLLKFDSSSDEEDYDDVPFSFRRQDPLLNALSSYPSSTSVSRASSSTSNSTSTSTSTSNSTPPSRPKSSKVMQPTKTSSIKVPASSPTSTSTNEKNAASARNLLEGSDLIDGGDHDHHNDTEEKVEQDSCSTKKKKKKKRRKKKKKKENDSTSADEVQNNNATRSSSSSAARKNRKTVSFQTVNVSEFYREMGGGGIPADGGWPLALSDKKFREYTIPIDEFETRKQMELRDRYEKFVTLRRRNHRLRGNDNSSSGHHHQHHHGRKRSNSKHGDEMKRQRSNSKYEDDLQDSVPVFIPETFSFETRQYDYKPRGEDVHSEGGKNSELEWNEIKITGRNHLFSQLRESERKQILLRDADINEGDILLNPDMEKDNQHSHIKSTPPRKSKRKESITESNEAFCSLEVKHIRNELEQIRIQRSAEDSMGCSCRKLYVPVGKGSRHHRRLTERRVKDELRKRQVTVPSPATRDELEQLLHDTVERQGCCYGKDCICYRNGLGCQGDTCSCWHLSHTGHAKKENDFSVSGEEAKIICGNQNGIYIVDFSAIDSHRRKFIPALQDGICRLASN